MRRSNAPTLHTVAAEAGVSAMIASVVLNGARSSTRTSEATRARVLEVADRLGYRRNAAALGLSRSKMNCIGVTSVVDDFEINYYFLEVFNGILEASATQGQNVTVFSIGSWHRDEQKVLEFCDGRIDGMILIGPSLSEQFASLPCHTPFVTIHGNCALPYACNLDIDNKAGAMRIVRHLIAQGHRRILHITGGESPGAQERLQGYCCALEEAGISVDDSLIMPGTFSTETGRNAIAALLQRRNISFPTAIFCSNDAIAYGCMEALRNQGLHVPDTLSIVGFDDMTLASMTHPPLTTMRQPFRKMGKRAVEVLMAHIHSGPADGRTSSPDALLPPLSHTEFFATELVVRESVSPPANGPLRSSGVGSA